MKRLPPFLISIGLALSATAGWPNSQPARAYGDSNLMDDAVFDRMNSMGEADIQNFVAAKGPCLGNYTSEDFSVAADGSTTYSGSVSAAHTIYHAAHQWGLNPQVILATLQKEESLVSGGNCDPWRYNSAMGYGCPDSGGCNPKYAGFTRQVLWGSWQLKFGKERSEGNLDWDGDGGITYAGYMTQGSYKRCNSCSANYYDGNANIDGANIHLDNGTTASLYSYTPHLHQSFPGIFETWWGVGSTSAGNPPLPAYRLQWLDSNDHLYTGSVIERNFVLSHLGFRDEGVGFFAYNGQGPNQVTVWRLFHPGARQHLFTTSDHEKDVALSIGFKMEGIAYFVYPDNLAPNLIPVYRLYQPRSLAHLYTTSTAERDNAASRLGYVVEGTAWWSAN